MSTPDQSKGDRSRDEVLAGEYVLGVLAGAERQKVEERLPRLFDTVISELHSILPRKMVEQGGFDRTYLEERLTKAVAARFGEGTVYKIYIKDMQIYK